MITENHSKECLNKAVIYAIAGAARHTNSMGGGYSEPSHDYGLDGTFQHSTKRGKRMYQSGFALDFQLKATKNWRRTGGNIIYDLRNVNYNDIAIQNGDFSRGANKKILLLYCMPERLEDALLIDHDVVKLFHSCYYTFLDGAVPVSEKGHTTVYIPESNLFTPTILDSILEDIYNGRMR